MSNLADTAENHTLRSTSASQLCPIKARGLMDRLTAALPLRLFHITCCTRLLTYAVKPLASAGMQSWLVAAATSSHGLNSMLPTATLSSHCTATLAAALAAQQFPMAKEVLYPCFESFDTAQLTEIFFQMHG
ncbi:hypothetical protein H0G86_003427 [Trichoderma simmonsii]|uniref:Uncharacterized protein n=1 Tax=Trichoderma simmonsii TaxID=1491479 RepID=A0A8G0PCI0_9HYPO|nr:hypothetical protein H0G86_003427 [Trichoderma simmonsii]